MTTLADSALWYNEVFESLKAAGFDRDEALYLTGLVLQAQAIVAAGSRDG